MKVASLVLFVTTFVLIFSLLRRIKRGEISFTNCLFWFIIWLSMGFFGMFPKYVDMVMGIVSMQQREFFISISALFIIYLQVFNMYCEQTRNRRLLEKLTQEIAIVNYRLENPDLIGLADR